MYFKLPRFSSAHPAARVRRAFWLLTGSFAFYCPSRAVYLAGTVNQIAVPQKPFFLMIDLLRALK